LPAKQIPFGRKLVGLLVAEIIFKNNFIARHKIVLGVGFHILREGSNPDHGKRQQHTG